MEEEKYQAERHSRDLHNDAYQVVSLDFKGNKLDLSEFTLEVVIVVVVSRVTFGGVQGLFLTLYSGITSNGP